MSTNPVKVTHPFHPLSGQTIEYVERNTQWGDERIFYRSRSGQLASIPIAWTSLATVDPFVFLSKGRSFFRIDDLLQLVSLIEEIQS